MRLAVFDDFRVGVVVQGRVLDATHLVPRELDSWPEQRMNWLIRNWGCVSTHICQVAHSSGGRPVEDVRLRAINPAAPHVFAIPANYAAHLGEIGNRSITTGGRTARDVGFFLKAPASLSGAGEGIELPYGSSRRFDHECEMAVVIGKGGRNIRREDALDHVFGYSCLIDLTMRIEPGEYEEDRSLRKSFATFTPTGPWIVTADELGPTNDLRTRLSVNGEQRQHARIGDMIVDVAESIELISSVAAIQPGDIIASGTPKGVGPLKVGDTVEIGIDGIGSMAISVGEAALAPRAF
ncbi:fumarylacetoacetate hydrolase family protein [Rhodococcus sp. ACPA1]|uniref:fumarylacetoacetate hydrolase family protein n=1 Tax=Rhodococcus sp. ACPA1 TaxID=2028572 RepID=UPI000BB15F98|nr:fumarylacetoacetate hydrolase family protein [Rhodococcus sp. ACPA1]PBC51543.1 fumarylacetoacetate hydrolase [Rhodococcus sp. ACPA1]